MKGRPACYFCNAPLKHGQTCTILTPSGLFRSEWVKCCPRCATTKAGANAGNKDQGR